MPPWAAPVCERVGYSFDTTHVLTVREASRAARRPAPPAPTITASSLSKVVIAGRGTFVGAPARGAEAQLCGRVPAGTRRPRAPAGRVEDHQWTSLATCSSITIEIGIMPATKTAMVP